MLGVTLVNVAVVIVVVSIMGGKGDAVVKPVHPAILEVTDQRISEDESQAGTVLVSSAVPVDHLKDKVIPFLNTYCINCHGPKKQSADLTLHQYTDKLSILRGRKTWLTASHMIHTSEMPSGKGPKPTQEERDWMVQWIEKTLNEIDCDKRDPGRVTIRRLNRLEYNNTVRDLLGVDFTPADDFPTDDVGYGFDNIGDVLSMPPVLLEKYLRAAQQVTTAAIANDPGSKGTPVQFITPSNMAGGENERRVKVVHLTGDVTTDIEVPRDGKYEFRIFAYASQAGDELVKMGLVLGGQQKEVFDIKDTGGRGQLSTHTLNLKRGKLPFALRFLNNFKDEKNPDPKRRDRNLYITAIEIIGPIFDKPEVVAMSQIFTRLPKADDSDWREAAREILARKAMHAYRSPVTQNEVARLVRFVEQVKGDGGTFAEGVELALQALLVSPSFLFRIELDADPTNPKAIRTINDHELATRLSYFIWSSMPDEELFALADKGILRQPAVLEKQVRSMLKDPKAAALVQGFAAQWLQLRSLERITPDRKQFPNFDQPLRQAMLRETELFFETVIKEDRSILDFIDGRFTFVNGRLAQHYGIPNITGDSFQRISLDGTQRSGVLTQASILTITSNPTRTSPVLRGKYVLEEILGTPPPPPPPDVPELPADESKAGAGETLSMRERLKLHLTNPTCASCHEKMDPIGFGLENYDGIGRWRTNEGKHPIDASGTMPSGESFKSPAQLKAMLLDRKNEFARNLAEKLLTFALGRGLEYYDKCAVDDIMKAMQKDDYRFSAMVMAIVTSDPFNKRRGKQADEP